MGICSTTAGAYELSGSNGTARSNTAFFPAGLSMRNDKDGRVGRTSKPSSLGVMRMESGAPPRRTVESMMLTLATAPGGTSKSFLARAGAAAPMARIELNRMVNVDDFFLVPAKLPLVTDGVIYRWGMRGMMTLRKPITSAAIAYALPSWSQAHFLESELSGMRSHE